MSSWDRVERLIGAHNLAQLAQKRVGVIGLGSGGGFVALSLAMSGVGKFLLVDDDTLEASNVMRHVADRRDLGRPKTDVVADLIRHRNPNADIQVISGRIEQHMDTLDGLDLLVCGVDGENAKYVINQVCLNHGLTAVYAGVYERGEGGDVVVIHPGAGPCYACWAAKLREGLTVNSPQEVEALDYGMIGADGTLEAEPGLWLHVTRIAATQADLALNELLLGTDVYQAMPANTVILANRAIEIINGQLSLPYTAVWVNIERDPHCLVCGDPQRLQQTLADHANAPVSLTDLMDATGIVLEEDRGDK